MFQRISFLKNFFYKETKEPAKDERPPPSEFCVYIETLFREHGYSVKIDGNETMPFFNADDLCKILEFPYLHNSYKNTLYTVPSIYKNSLKNLYKLYNRKDQIHHLSYNEEFSTYVTIGGLYFLIFNSKSKKLKKFEIFIMTEFLPKYQQYNYKKISDELELTKKKLEDLKLQNSILTDNNTDYLLKYNNVSQRNDVLKQQIYELQDALLRKKKDHQTTEIAETMSKTKHKKLIQWEKERMLFTHNFEYW